MIVAVTSGKGGTGKTLISTSLALSLEKPVLFIDADVEEPNAFLFLKPKIEKKEFIYLPKPIVDDTKCKGCGKCAEVCQYNAIAVVKGEVLIFHELCHSCGACSIACPYQAIFEVDVEKGIIESGTVQHIKFWQGKLTVGESSPTPLVKALKKKIPKDEIDTIIDTSPGTSCPVVEAVHGADFALLVTEPTPFGLHDLDLAVRMCDELKVKKGVLINRAGEGDELIEEYCEKGDIPILDKIPLKKEIAESYSRGETLIEAFKEYKDKFQNLWEKIKKLVK
ncbi:MAG TPA: (4Fe-4S)-binding protein [bacterium]|nr:(4Fe-4S)-binding protein [bacterium]HEX68129.1 (4Fe-4S)-binding protein [bacterium]